MPSPAPTVPAGVHVPVAQRAGGVMDSTTAAAAPSTSSTVTGRAARTSDAHSSSSSASSTPHFLSVSRSPFASSTASSATPPIVPSRSPGLTAAANMRHATHAHRSTTNLLDAASSLPTADDIGGDAGDEFDDPLLPPSVAAAPPQGLARSISAHNNGRTNKQHTKSDTKRGEQRDERRQVASER